MIKSENATEYATVAEDRIIKDAISILERRMARGPAFTSPDAVKEFLVVKYCERQSEMFGVIYLDNRHRVLAHEELFQGTIDGASVYPREVVRQVLHHNAAAVVLFHNHPSGVGEPSRADETITRRLQETLGLIDVRVLDHLIVGGTEVVSFAERGLL